MGSQTPKKWPIFKEARQNRIFQDVIEQIQEAILDGQLKAGETLPAERELKEMFNTSRGTVREALRVLEERGLIQIKLGVGGGAVVRTVTPENASASIGLLIRSNRVSLDHLAEFREGIEGNVASLAAARATDGDIAALAVLLGDAVGCMEGPDMDTASFVDIDKRFHLEVARISQNPMSAFICRLVIENMHRYFDRFLSMTRKEIRQNYQDLCDIKQAIATGRADDARRLASHHIDTFHQRMKTRE